MKSVVFRLLWAIALLASSLASAAIVEYTFDVGNYTVERLCNPLVITAVNGSLPGPTINVREGDTLVVHVLNNSPYNMTIHWHGIFQLLTAWYDGPEFVTQCGIPPSGNFTYKFNIIDQEGTLWWHAHSTDLRATVYGALIIRPRLGHSYPFSKPYQELPPILFGEWWNRNVVDIENEIIESGGPFPESNAYTINGLPGDFYTCSQNQTFQLKVRQGKVYLMRIINSALNTQLFFKIANHNFTVVAIDATYTNAYATDVIVAGPGHTVDVLFRANQPVGSYYMAASPYHTVNFTFNNIPTRGILVYENSTSASPVNVTMPINNDTDTAHRFFTNITGLVGGPHWVPVPLDVDESMFITFGLGMASCLTCTFTQLGLRNRFSASMNNESFVLPSGRGLSMLEAFYNQNVSGVYTRDFPDNPPLVFDYTSQDTATFGLPSLAYAPKSTKVKTLRFNSTVQVVFQNTAILAPENHPMHIHGFNFHVLAQGFGNYNATRDEPTFNLVNPQIRNTISVPAAGWAVIRFVANNPGIWLAHCHFDAHLPWGLSMAFEVSNMKIQRLCNEQEITAVNGILPGPTIRVREGDTLVVHVFNKSPYNITIHWHGIFQFLSAWADGPEYITQCPIQPGKSYTYKFTITGQEGTLWWHAHSSWIRATAYGALIIDTRRGRFFPFPKPHGEAIILLGEWWSADVVEVERLGLSTGSSPPVSDAYTINGLPGDLYQCSDNQTYTLKVVQEKTYLLRIINAAMNNQHFFKIANHKMTVVAVDATYTKPYVTDVLVLAPGHTTDVLFTADQSVGYYYMAANPYISGRVLRVDNTVTRGIVVYAGANGRSESNTPLMPILPVFNDNPTAHKFYTNLTSLVGGPHWVPVPTNVDEHMFVTFGLNLEPCPENALCKGPLGQRLSASMNNESFVLPANKSSSMLEAFYNKNPNGIYTVDFPDQPPMEIDYTSQNISLDTSLLFAPKSTKVKRLKFNSRVEIVLQNTAFITVENHPIHIHGFNFHVLAQGFGNYDPINDPKKFNLVDPQIRNTIAVPVGGWAVIRFRANNPGIWMAHCHLETHLPLGLGFAFEVENGPTSSTTLPPPPADLPKC
ncbi:hypothetical protein L6164_003464 [Bauhinia variegata]|uniref:Uncharacterized protein n=1 Tax=Bauhinia variegata TaxID=167791 RepID=A0ACB9Q203_BAUVA|nr:hypothetical protein L6164_003464 [Bauhinia variegata]